MRRIKGDSAPTPARKAERVALRSACPLATLLLPRITCPRCSARPRLRISDTLREVCTGVDPTALLATYRCRCGEVFALTASSFVNAWDLRP